MKATTYDAPREAWLESTGLPTPVALIISDILRQIAALIGYKETP